MASLGQKGHLHSAKTKVNAYGINQTGNKSILFSALGAEMNSEWLKTKTISRTTVIPSISNRTFRYYDFVVHFIRILRSAISIWITVQIDVCKLIYDDSFPRIPKIVAKSTAFCLRSYDEFCMEDANWRILMRL